MLGSMSVACTAKLNVLPEVSKYPDQVEVLLRGGLVYEGKPEYLPRTIAGQRDGGNKLTLHYAYEDSHNRREILKLTQGYQQVGSKSQYVVGNLEIRDGEKVIKKYTAVATLTGWSEYSETLTEMRRRGLLAVRDNIEAQMYLDGELLRNLSH
jgi:hypothetical protein